MMDKERWILFNHIKQRRTYLHSLMDLFGYYPLKYIVFDGYYDRVHLGDVETLITGDGDLSNIHEWLDVYIAAYEEVHVNKMKA